jgi:hypothetical protein
MSLDRVKRHIIHDELKYQRGREDKQNVVRN